MIALERVTVRYGSANPIRDLTVEMSAAPTVIMGPSGSGKSTLLRVISGLQRPDEGQVTLDGEPIQEPSWRSAGDSRVALIHQDYRLVPFLTVRDNVALGAEMRGSPVTPQRVAECLERVGLPTAFGDRYPDTLSGGEQQRVAISRALACDARLLVADEPTGALDVDNTELVAELLVSLAEVDGLGVLIATHDPLVAAHVHERLQLSEGRLCVAV